MLFLLVSTICISISWNCLVPDNCVFHVSCSELAIFTSYTQSCIFAGNLEVYYCIVWCLVIRNALVDDKDTCVSKLYYAFFLSDSFSKVKAKCLSDWQRPLMPLIVSSSLSCRMYKLFVNYIWAQWPYIYVVTWKLPVVALTYVYAHSMQVCMLSTQM